MKRIPISQYHYPVGYVYIYIYLVYISGNICSSTEYVVKDKSDPKYTAV